jgi:hypothetical protein
MPVPRTLADRRFPVCGMCRPTGAAKAGHSDAAMADHFNHALRYRNRAEELRIQADQMKVEDVRAALLRLAAEFDRLAVFHESSAALAG